MSNNNILLLFTTAFPNVKHNKSETFLEIEIGFLSKRFFHVYIFCSSPKFVDNYELPKNISVITHIDKLSFLRKVFSLSFFLSKVFISEYLFVRKTLNLPITFYKLKVMLIEWSKAILLYKKVESFLANISSNHNIFLYSYWNDYKSIAISLLKDNKLNFITFSRAHRSDIYYEINSQNYLPLKGYVFSKIDKVFFISNHSYNYINQITNNKHSNKFSVSRLGTLKRSNSKKLTQKLNNCLNILSCSHIIPVKRVDLIINSLNEIDDFTINWYHIGEQDDFNHPGYFENYISPVIENLENKKNININFLGQISNKQVLDFYKTNSIDLFINVSESEGIPVSIMEAMSFGVPVIATNVGGVNEIVDNFNGYLINVNTNSNEISRKISSFFNLSNDKKSYLSDGAFKTWNNHYNASKNYTQFINQIIDIQYEKINRPLLKSN